MAHFLLLPLFFRDILNLLGSGSFCPVSRFLGKKRGTIMDMLETLQCTVTEEECDRQGYITVPDLVRHLVRAATTRNRMEGCSKQVLMSELKAVWMFRRIIVRQYRHLHAGDELVGFASSRTVCGRHYAQQGDLYRDGELVARLNDVMMPVVLRGRRRLSCADTEPLFQVSALNEAEDFDPLPTIEDFPYTREKSFTMADCDANGHYSTFDYPELVCQLTGYYEGERPLVDHMQVDFVKECVNGSVIRMGAIPQGDGFKVQGQHISTGKPAFNAYCVYKR